MKCKLLRGEYAVNPIPWDRGEENKLGSACDILTGLDNNSPSESVNHCCQEKYRIQREERVCTKKNK